MGLSLSRPKEIMQAALQSVVDSLEKQFQAESSQFRGQVSLLIAAEHILAACKALKEEHAFERLAALTAVDYWPQPEPRFHVVYQFHSFAKKQRLEIRVPLEGDEPILESIIPVYPSADWHERELWDMFGIRFSNHPDLRRILMPEDWEGHPLRKDYPLDYEEVQFTFNFEEIDLRKPRPKD